MVTKKNMAIIACVCILGLITTYTILNLHGNYQALTGTVLYNNTPATGASMVAVYPDHKQTVTSDEHGKYVLPVDIDHASELLIYYNGKVILKYGPPFSANRDYGANINVQEAPTDEA